MERTVSPRKKLKSPSIDPTVNINIKTSVTCGNVPEGLFDATAAKKHFSKFGKVQRIRLFPKKQMCIVEYDQPMSAERAVLNAGAYDGFMFDVTRTKPRVRRRSKKEDDPDWVPDSDVEEELSAMSGAPSYRITRQKPMDIELEVNKNKTVKKLMTQSPQRKFAMREKNQNVLQPVTSTDTPLVVSMTQTSLSTAEAAAELHQLRAKVSLTPDEQWRILDARDRILRAWGGAGSRVKVGGATIGTCPDMCPEKELLHREAEHQVMTLETVPDSDGQLERWRAVKQYSRSSADQEIPMCYELRPATVLMRTCAYLLNEIADTRRQVTLADWFHFMWDRLRGIRKDITQQALCCADSICLVEMCARFHAHCAARLADLEHTQFDQKLNTDNLTKCLQTLKHMYADVETKSKPREAEFRGYIALLNLGDANFWWEIKQLPQEIQKSEAIVFAIQIFNALDNNNFVRFFRLVKEKATYLQACILLRYFNDVRARALARIVKAYAPRGGSRYPAEELMNSLAFESIESMKSFVNHYGLRFSKDDSELTVILDRNQFIEDMDPFPVARALNLIESKRQSTVGEVIAGGQLPSYNYTNQSLYSSFNKDGRLKETALIAEEQGYNTVNDSNKDVQSLKAEIQRLSQGGRIYNTDDSKVCSAFKPEMKTRSPNKTTLPTKEISINKTFSFKPAIPVAPTESIKSSPEKIVESDSKNSFLFSKAQDIVGSNILARKDATTFFKPPNGKAVFDSKTVPDGNFFAKVPNENKDPFKNSQNLFQKPDNVFGQFVPEFKQGESNNVFQTKTIFSKKDNDIGPIDNAVGTKNIFSKSATDILKPDSTKFETGGNIFAKALATQNTVTKPSIFGSFNKGSTDANNMRTNSENVDGFNKGKSIFAVNGDSSSAKLSPGSLFKNAITTESKSYSIFQSKNKTSTVAENIINSINDPKTTMYDFDQNDNQTEEQLEQKRLMEERLKEEKEKEFQERIRQKEERRRELKQQEIKQQEERRREEERIKQEEFKKIEEARKREEEKRQEELKKKLEEERKAELKRKVEEEQKKYRQRVENESLELVEELLNEIREETLKEMLQEEMENMKKMMLFADMVTEEIWTELCDEMSYSEIKAEKFWTEKLMKKWFSVWKEQFTRNIKRRNLLEDTPVWLTEKTPTEEAAYLRRLVENAALRNMNAIHRGYKFTGELKQLPLPEPYNIMEIIKSPLLKRMKQINYPYDKCFFWKVTLISPGESKWICRKIELEKWLLDVFGDKKKHDDISETLIHVKNQSWIHLMDFAISVSLTNNDKKNKCGEALEGTNSLLFYAVENHNIFETIEETLKHKYPYQLVPVAIIMPKIENASMYNKVEHVLTNYVSKNIISGYKIFLVEPQNVNDSLNASTKSALKWLAKKYPQIPPLETDYLKSICQRYLGNEIWHRLKSESDTRMKIILKDLHKLIHCYNTAVDKLTEVLTNEDLFNYSTFPLEFQQYLNHNSPYPKPYEFISTNARNSGNISAIKDTMKKLKLPNPVSDFHPMSIISMQDQIRKYCNQIEWFENPEQVVCKIVAVMPNELSNLDMPHEDFKKYYEHYDLIDFLNVMVYEKINRLNNFDNRFAIYEKSVLETYCQAHWLYETEVLTGMKHKPLLYEDDLDLYIKAKRRKIELESMDYLMLEDNDCTMVEENIKATNESITKLSNCKEAVNQLEKQIEEKTKKSVELENLLRAALSDV